MWSSLMFKYYHLEYGHVPCFLGLSSGGSKRKYPDCLVASPQKKEKLNKLHNNFTKDLNEYEC